MFEDRLQEEVTLRVSDGTFNDGQTTYNEYEAYALISDFTRLDIKRYGNIKNGKIFLLRCANEPAAGSQIIHSTKTYDLKDIQVCRDLDGNVECYRCAVV